MDSFTERILERARERQKKLLEYNDGVTNSVDKFSRISSTLSQPNLTDTKKIMRKEVVSDSCLISNASIIDEVLKENKSEEIPKFSRQNSKTRISSDMAGSPKQLQTLNIQNDNFNMEIKLTSSENIRVEVEIEERDTETKGGGTGIVDAQDKNDIDKPALRDDAKNRLQRLGKLYAGGDDANISSPIHRTEATFLVGDDNAVSSDVHDELTDVGSKKSYKGLSRLAALAKDINQWEDDVKQPPKTNKKTDSPKKTWKPSAPKPQSVCSNSVSGSPPKSKHGKGQAPQPPIPSSNATAKSVNSDSDDSPKISKNTEIAKGTPKQLKWDQAVLESLESQGFTRTTSSSRLIYNYGEQGKNEKYTKSTKTQDSEAKCNCIVEDQEEEKENAQNEVKSSKKPDSDGASAIQSPSKIRGNVIANTAAIFETSPPKNAKDPALMSVSERKALFEKNKGVALLPKAAFAMPMPTKMKKNSEKVCSKNVAKNFASAIMKGNKTVKGVNPPTSSSKGVNSPAKTALPETGGIASKLAALLENKTTIAQEQIESNIREQRQKEMDILLNRFTKNKEVLKTEADNSEESDVEEATETTAMIPGKAVQIVGKSGSIPKPPPPPPPIASDGPSKSAEKRRSSGHSPKVAAVLEDVKRIKVSPPKPGRLYPCLSDIEAATETEGEPNSPTPPNSSPEDSYNESDEGNTSFGREILQVVCKNQTPQKRPIYDESTASDISDVLDDMDDYLDEALGYDGDDSPGPTPPKQGKTTTPAAVATQPSHSFNYKNFSPKVSPKKNSPEKPKFKSPVKIITTPKSTLEQLPTHVIDGDSVLPLTHTVSFYRRQQTQGAKTPVRQVTIHPVIEESSENISSHKATESEDVQCKIQQLLDEVGKQQTVISQASQALNLCVSRREFTGSTEQVEAERLLLLATHRRQAALHEIQRLKVEGTLRPQSPHNQNVPLERGSLCISNITLPLKREYVRALAAAGGKGHHVICLVKCVEQVVPTQLVSTVASSSKNPDLDLTIPGIVRLENIYSDFTVTFEVYCLQAQEEFLPHEVKYHINSKKSNSKLTPKKAKQDTRMIVPPRESPAGPQAVHSPSFALMGYVVFSIQAVNRTHWTLNKAPSMSPLEGSVDMQVTCALAVSVEHQGFLTMFEDVSGFGAWHRRWCLLKGHNLSYWKYPDDERKKPPIDTINLRNCITKEVGPVSRDICARLHTVLIERQREAQSQDKDGLIMVCKGPNTVIRHLLSADTKDERITWCNMFNKALTAIRMWGNSSE